jgi:hypothetical protein
MKRLLNRQTLSVPDAVVLVMTEYHHDRELQLHACKALHKLASNSEADNTALGIAGACETVVAAIVVDTSDAQMCESAITAVCTLAANSVNKSKLRIAGAADTIQIVLERHHSGAVAQLAQAALQLLQLHSTAPYDSSSGNGSSSSSNSSSVPSYSATKQPCAPPLSPQGKPICSTIRLIKFRDTYEPLQCFRCC